MAANKMQTRPGAESVTPSDYGLDETGVAYQLLALLLCYPDGPDFDNALRTTQDWLAEAVWKNDGLDESQFPVQRTNLRSVLTLFQQFTTWDFEQCAIEYVRAFDFRESTSLYLTSHELGDSRSRGPALIALRNLFKHYGFEESTDELPDFLPLLLEFLSELPKELRPADLQQRMAKVCRKIAHSLPADSLYRGVFNMLEQVLPEVPDEENPFPLHEKADTDELPYPLTYD